MMSLFNIEVIVYILSDELPNIVRSNKDKKVDLNVIAPDYMIDMSQVGFMDQLSHIVKNAEKKYCCQNLVNCLLRSPCKLKEAFFMEKINIEGLTKRYRGKAAPAQPSVEELKAKLVQATSISESELLELAQARATHIRDQLVAAGKMPAEYIFILEPKVAGTGAEPCPVGRSA